MTKRYYAAYTRTDINTGPLYVVRDGDTKTDVSGEMPYHEANDQAGRRNGGEYVSDAFEQAVGLSAGIPPYWRYVAPVQSVRRGYTLVTVNDEGETVVFDNRPSLAETVAAEAADDQRAFNVARALGQSEPDNG